MTDQKEKDEQGVIVAVLERMRTQRLPRALEIKEKVDAGEALSDYDLAFLKEVFADVNTYQYLWERHPDLNTIAGRVISLYHEITKRALENESGAHPT
jgi:hypothetical protein